VFRRRRAEAQSLNHRKCGHLGEEQEKSNRKDKRILNWSKMENKADSLSRKHDGSFSKGTFTYQPFRQ
jgi:hypothetical protein